MIPADIEFDPTPDQEPGDIRDNAERWIRENPDVMSLFERFALELAARKAAFGMRLVAERVRWECAFAYTTPFKINDHHTPYVARELVRRHPFLVDHLSFRRTKYEA